MKIKYFGTAAAEGWPGVFCRCDRCRQARELGGKNLRTRSQALIDGALLVDYPPDTYLHVLQGGLPLSDITQLIVTHSHDDHFYPRELCYRARPFSYGLPGQLHVYGNDAVSAQFHRECPPPRDREDAPFAAVFHYVEPFAPFAAGPHTVTALLANHDKRERCYNYIVEREGKRLLYANDTGFFPEATWEYLAGRRFDLVSMDCTCGDTPDGNNHMGIADDLEMARRLTEMGCMDEKTVRVATHFSHNGGLLHDELVGRFAPHGFLVAYDGMEVEF